MRKLGRWRPRRLKLFGRGADRGASAVELAILAPALIFISMLIVQFALWLDATHAALAAAQEGDRVARAAQFNNQSSWQQTATQVAMNYYHGLDTSVLANVSAQGTYDANANTVAVTVTGKLSGIFPLTISETVSGPVECFRATGTGSLGVNCATNAG